MDSYQVALYEIYGRVVIMRQAIRNDACRIALKRELHDWGEMMGDVGTMIELKDDQLRACSDLNVHRLLEMADGLTERIYEFAESNNLDFEVLRSLAPKKPEDL